MSVIRNYERGKRVKSIEHFDKCINKGTVFFIVWFGNRPKLLHYGFVGSWQYRYLKNMINQGCIYIAKKKKENE